MSLFPVLGALLGPVPGHSSSKVQLQLSTNQLANKLTHFCNKKNARFVLFCAFMSATCKTSTKDNDCAYRAVKELESLCLKHGDKSCNLPTNHW